MCLRATSCFPEVFTFLSKSGDTFSRRQRLQESPAHGDLGLDTTAKLPLAQSSPECQKSLWAWKTPIHHWSVCPLFELGSSQAEPLSHAFRFDMGLLQCDCFQKKGSPSSFRVISLSVSGIDLLMYFYGLELFPSRNFEDYQVIFVVVLVVVFWIWGNLRAILHTFSRTFGRATPPRCLEP